MTIFTVSHHAIVTGTVDGGAIAGDGHTADNLRVAFQPHRQFKRLCVPHNHRPVVARAHRKTAQNILEHEVNSCSTELVVVVFVVVVVVRAEEAQ